jgi:hypothetical protein
MTNSIPVKRTALTDSKTGMPVFHPSATAAAVAALHHQQQQQQQMHSAAAAAQHHHLALAQHHPVAAVTSAAALNYPTTFNFPMQYTPYISLPCKLSLAVFFLNFIV